MIRLILYLFYWHWLVLACRRAFLKAGINPKNPNYTQWVWHCHHRVLAEVLNDSVDARLNYIITDKNINEVATRIKLFRPVYTPPTSIPSGRTHTYHGQTYVQPLQEFMDVMNTLHRLQCSNCPWDGQTIFPHHQT